MIQAMAAASCQPPLPTRTFGFHLTSLDTQCPNSNEIDSPKCGKVQEHRLVPPLHPPGLALALSQNVPCLFGWRRSKPRWRMSGIPQDQSGLDKWQQGIMWGGGKDGEVGTTNWLPPLVPPVWVVLLLWPEACHSKYLEVQKWPVKYVSFIQVKNI